jgi:exopolyphosphatase/guanosine-5'-triphosphate,3'-diphosphate pyrophosphatase
MRVATVDIGTNTVLLLVAERDTDGSLRAIAERATITRLGQGVDRSRRLAPDAIARTKACLDEYGRVTREHGAARVAVVGTSAMRDAEGGGELRDHVRSTFGVDVRVVSGRDEGRLTFQGALSGLTLGVREGVAVFDIGGGSTEIVIADGASASDIAYVDSFDVGSVRLSERHVTHDPPTRTELDTLTRVSRETFGRVPPLSGNAPPVGIAGTMTTLAAVSLELTPYDGARVHGHVMPQRDLRRVVDHLAAIDLKARRSVLGMEPKRADVIVAGGAIALALLEHWNAPAVVISDRGVRWGLAEELLAGAANAPIRQP